MCILRIQEKRPGGKKNLVEKNDSGKKTWWKESLVCFGKDGNNGWCLFLCLINIKKIQDEECVNSDEIDLKYAEKNFIL